MGDPNGFLNDSDSQQGSDLIGAGRPVPAGALLSVTSWQPVTLPEPAIS